VEQIRGSLGEAPIVAQFWILAGVEMARYIKLRPSCQLLSGTPAQEAPDEGSAANSRETEAITRHPRRRLLLTSAIARYPI